LEFLVLYTECSVLGTRSHFRFWRGRGGCGWGEDLAIPFPPRSASGSWCRARSTLKRTAPGEALLCSFAALARLARSLPPPEELTPQSKQCTEAPTWQTGRRVWLGWARQRGTRSLVSSGRSSLERAHSNDDAATASSPRSLSPCEVEPVLSSCKRREGVKGRPGVGRGGVLGGEGWLRGRL